MSRSPASKTRDLAPALDRLYADFNVQESVADPIWRVRRYQSGDDQEVVAFIAAALAFGRVQSVLNSIDGMLAVMGDSPARFVRRFQPERDKAVFAHLVHRWTNGADFAALVWILRQMLDRSGSIEGFFVEGLATDAVDVGAALESFSTRALALDVSSVYGSSARSDAVMSAAMRHPGLFSVVKRRHCPTRMMCVQAAQPVSPVDGPPRSSRPRPVDAGPARAVDGAAGHAHHPSRAVPSLDDAEKSRVAHGGGHYRVAPSARSGGSDPLRLFDLPPWHDERLRLWQQSRRRALPVEGRLSAAPFG
jgi:hypothetical protein